MQGKELHDFLFQLYDYADQLGDKIQPGAHDNGSYFMMMVFIEKYFDSIGRFDIKQAAEAANDPSIDPQQSLSLAHQRIDALRSRIAQLVEQYDFDPTLDHLSQNFAIDWHKRQ